MIPSTHEIDQVDRVKGFPIHITEKLTRIFAVLVYLKCISDKIGTKTS